MRVRWPGPSLPLQPAKEFWQPLAETITPASFHGGLTSNKLRQISWRNRSYFTTVSEDTMGTDCQWQGMQPCMDKGPHFSHSSFLIPPGARKPFPVFPGSDLHPIFPNPEAIFLRREKRGS
jgi:hypothetical protein